MRLSTAIDRLCRELTFVGPALTDCLWSLHAARFRVSSWAAVGQKLVFYYSRTMEDLVVATFHRRSEYFLDRLRQAKDFGSTTALHDRSRSVNHHGRRNAIGSCGSFIETMAKDVSPSCTRLPGTARQFEYRPPLTLRV
jgi:hypothetical protein